MGISLNIDIDAIKRIPFRLLPSMETLYNISPILEFPAHKKARIQANTDLVERAQQATLNFKAAKRNGVTGEKLSNLAKASGTLAKEVLAISELIHITAKSDESLHDQIIENEKVHAIKNEDDKGPIVETHRENLIDHRLGNKGDDTDCMGLIVKTENGPLLLAHVFRSHAKVEKINGLINVEKIPSSPDTIKTTPVQPTIKGINLTGYWAISSAWRGSAPALISRLAEITPKGRFETTISPVRGFTETQNREELFKLTDDEIRKKVVTYLLENDDSVKDFHLGNGASIGWININRDAPVDSKDFITINYLYDRTALTQNKNNFTSLETHPVSDNVYNLLDQKQVDHTINVPLPQTPAEPLPRVA